MKRSRKLILVAKSPAKNLRFEPLSSAHIEDVLAIEAVSNGSPWSERSFRNELENPQSVFRVAFASGKVVGYGGLWRIVDEAHITTVAIAPEYRRMGIAERLLKELLTASKEGGIASATLEVRAGNVAAIALYRKLGFESAAVRRGYYPDNKEDALVMWLYDLQSWEHGK